MITGFLIENMIFIPIFIFVGIYVFRELRLGVEEGASILNSRHLPNSVVGSSRIETIDYIFAAKLFSIRVSSSIYKKNNIVTLSSLMSVIVLSVEMSAKGSAVELDLDDPENINLLKKCQRDLLRIKNQGVGKVTRRSNWGYKKVIEVGGSSSLDNIKVWIVQIGSEYLYLFESTSTTYMLRLLVPEFTISNAVTLSESEAESG